MEEFFSRPYDRSRILAEDAAVYFAVAAQRSGVLGDSGQGHGCDSEEMGKVYK